MINNYTDQDFQNLQVKVNNHDSQINSLISDVNDLTEGLHNTDTTLQTYVSKTDKLETSLNQLIIRVDNLVNKVNEIRNEIDTYINPTLDDHNQRITTLESSELIYFKTRKVPNPMFSEELNGTVLYMPSDLTKKDFEEYNEELQGKIYFGWFQKIFNPHGYGKIFFDFAPGEEGEGTLKGITIGQQARVIIPLGVKVKYQHSKTALFHTVYNPLAVNGGLLSGLLTSKTTGEVMVLLVNTSPGLVYIGAKDPVITLLHTFTYSTVPTQYTDEEAFNQY